MRKRDKINKIFALVLILLGITIGYAALSTTLKINGTTNISKNTWDVYWDNLGNISKSSSTTVVKGAEIDEHDGEKIDFEIKLNEPGDYYEFQVDAVNNGTLDAMTSLVSTIINSDENASLPPYIIYTIKYADGVEIDQYHLLKKKANDVATTERFKIRIEFSSDITEQQLESIDDEISYDMNIQLPYVQADDNAIDRPMPPAVSFATDSWATIAYAGNNAAKQTSVVNDACGSVYHVGDTREVDMGSLGTHTVRIVNCSTPAVCETDGFSQTACGFVVEFVDILNNHRMNYYSGVFPPESGTGNMGGWALSDMRAYLNNGVYLQGNDNGADYTNSGIFSKLPADLKKSITGTTVVTGKGWTENNTSSTEVSSVEDKLYIWSSIELIGDKIANEAEYDYTRQLDYYSSLGVNKDYSSPLIKMYNDEAASWWLRSVDNSPFDFNAISETGGWPYKVSTSEYGVSPAFKLK